MDGGFLCPWVPVHAARPLSHAYLFPLRCCTGGPLDRYFALLQTTSPRSRGVVASSLSTCPAGGVRGRPHTSTGLARAAFQTPPREGE